MKLWLFWVVACAAAFGFGGRFGAALSPSRDVIVIGYLALASSLLLAGLLQWLILRRLIVDVDRWALVSVASVAILGILVFGLGMLNRDIGWVLGVIVGWIALGALQWLVLRGRVDGANWWVLAHALGLIVAIPVVGLVSWAAGVPAGDGIGGVVRWLAFGGAYGAVTGTALWWLLRDQLGMATS